MEKKDKEITKDSIEGYAACTSTKQKCLTDCIAFWENTPTLSDVN